MSLDDRLIQRKMDIKMCKYLSWSRNGILVIGDTISVREKIIMITMYRQLIGIVHDQVLIKRAVVNNKLQKVEEEEEVKKAKIKRRHP